MPNPVVHFEIRSSGADKLQKFYSDLFEWHIDASNPMGYGLVDTHTETGINGGHLGDERRAEPGQLLRRGGGHRREVEGGGGSAARRW